LHGLDAAARHRRDAAHPGPRLGPPAEAAMIEANLVLFGGFVLLLVAGAPLAVALGLAGIGAIAVGMDAASLDMVGINAYASVAKYPLLAIPLFVLAGMLFERSGVAARLVTLGMALVGPRRGGLAVVAVL